MLAVCMPLQSIALQLAHQQKGLAAGISFHFMQIKYMCCGNISIAINCLPACPLDFIALVQVHCISKKMIHHQMRKMPHVF